MTKQAAEIAESIHIYPLSRLVAAPASKWEQMLAQMEEAEKVLYRYYQPAREAIVYLASAGAAMRKVAVRKIQSGCATVPCGPNQDVYADNLRAFEVFEAKFLPRIADFKLNLLKARLDYPVKFAGIELRGLPHMIVADTKGRTRYVYLHPSNWKTETLKAYLELLTVVVEEAYNAQAKDIWCMDLRDGKDVKWLKPSIRMRNECAETIRHYTRVVARSTIALN